MRDSGYSRHVASFQIPCILDTARISQGPGELKKSAILLILFTDFASDFATTGKVFQSSFLYTCSDTEGLLP
jgi:hypothetical protein